MKIQLTCMKCVEEELIKECVPLGGQGKARDLSIHDFKNVVLNEDGLYEMECINGHKTLTVLQNEKFEVLFDMGLSALLDGNKLEAVACVHSSVERFHEWCIKVFLTHNMIEISDFEKTWVYVKKQSERQLGAFYFLYIQTFKKAPETFDESKTGFRNRVIHNGEIPNDKELYEYIEYVYHYIRKILKQIKEQFDEDIRKVTLSRLAKIKADNFSTMGLSCALGLFKAEKEDGSESLDKAINGFKRRHELSKC